MTESELEDVAVGAGVLVAVALIHCRGYATNALALVDLGVKMPVSRRIAARAIREAIDELADGYVAA